MSYGSTLFAEKETHLATSSSPPSSASSSSRRSGLRMVDASAHAFTIDRYVLLECCKWKYLPVCGLERINLTKQRHLNPQTGEFLLVIEHIRLP